MDKEENIQDNTEQEKEPVTDDEVVNKDEETPADDNVDTEDKTEAVEPSLILPELLAYFLYVYPEFKPLFKDKESIEYFTMLSDKVISVYFSNKPLKSKADRYPLFMLIAHKLVMSGFSKSIGILSQDGAIASSSVGEVSVSFQATPYSNGDEFTYNLSLTPYGREYLEWLARQAGLRIVN
mgnify:CR=1 FL=1